MSVCHQCGATLREQDRFCASCGAGVTATSGPDPLIGRLIGGAYRVQALVGEGGMGRVYRAEQSMLGRTVAIKVVHPHLLGDEQSAARFYTEARAASRLNHPNSVSIIDFGRSDDGVLYLVMEYLQGRDLVELMAREGPLPFDRICDLLCAVLGALAEAHALEVVHRDLKPENVIVERMRAGGDLVKVVDFGLAKMLTGVQQTPSITLPGFICGTPEYMSPEQGRGLEVDGRGDLYSVGVLLFQMLTGELPFPANTPTDVVMRHITEPVPDPRVVAPHRHIPSALVDVVMQAMAKELPARFQSAEAMAQALRDAVGALRPGAQEVRCGLCGGRSPHSNRYCGDCGALLPARSSTPPHNSIPPRLSLTPVDQRMPLVGRARELDQLDAMRMTATGRCCSVHLDGEPGVGKTRLLTELAERCAAAGDLVVGAGPHPSGASVPYAAMLTLMTGLLELAPLGLESLAADPDAPLDPLVRAGLEELLTPTGLRGSAGASRAGAVAAALAFAVTTAQQRTGAERVVLIVDDLHRCDGLSARVLRAFDRRSEGTSVWLVTAGTAEKPYRLPADATTLTVLGIEFAELDPMLAHGTLRPLRDRSILPLYFEQLQTLGDLQGLADSSLPRLADVVMQRVQRLDVHARRLLQAACVIGMHCQISELEALVDAQDLSAMGMLLRQRLLIPIDEGALQVAHPFIRDVVAASIPAEARKALHERALQLAVEAHAPLEVRAEHAFNAAEPLSALVLLERMGDDGMRRGDAETAVLAFRRGVDLARREMLESGDTALEGALATFGRKLGRALAQVGDVAGAEGVLREALELSGPVSVQRVRLLAVLAEVVSRRGRRRDAARLLGQALELAAGQSAVEAAVEVYTGLAGCRRGEGDVEGAVQALEQALLCQPGYAPDRAATQDAACLDAMLRRAQLGVELGEVWFEAQDTQRGLACLGEASRLAEQAGSPYLVSRALGALARVEEWRGDVPLALAYYEEAATCAASAGDADGVDRWRSAAALAGHELA